MLIADSKMNAQDLKDRTKKFALRVMHLVDALPDTPKGRAVSSQLVRSGMSVAANYRAACRGRSHAEFISKIGIAEEEVDETVLWLELIVEDKLLPEKKNGFSAKGSKRTHRNYGGFVHLRVA